MKALIQIVIALTISIQIQAQEKVIKTESVTIENLIPYIVEKYTSTSSEQNIILLFESKKKRFAGEDAILFKQAVKYLSDKLSEDDALSIISYNALNGVVLERTPAKNMKKILNTLNDFTKHLDGNSEDGMTTAYNYADENYKEGAENTIIMIRNPNGSRVVTAQDVSNSSTLENAEVKKPKNNMVLLTAIAVLPELIAIIKD